MSKHDLIDDMIITERKKKSYISTRENNHLTKEEANELLKNKNFARQKFKEKTISNISPEVKARPKPINN